MSWNNNFDQYVGHYAKFREKGVDQEVPADCIRIVGSDIGRNVGFQRLAVHHVTLPANCRSSFPHAESLEEEFVFVLKGEPQLWLNGHIYDLQEGHGVGFPAGTGVGHCFINNTNSEVHLVVAGEKTKHDNFCSFPINPELKETCGIWWENPPAQSLGPHLGLPGPVLSGDRGKDQPSCIVFAPDEKSLRGFHYPGDNETFGEGFRMTDAIGLKALGIWYERLSPGKRSSFPHAHTHEEEFVYVIKGQPTLWMDGFSRSLQEGEFAAFPANTGVSHAVINNTDEEVIYICIGETEEFPDEKIFYPLNPLRNKECERKGWLWLSPPHREFGGHGGRADSGLPPGHLALRICTEADVEEVLEIYSRSPEYFLKVEGCLPTEEMARHAIVDGPPKKSEKYFKEFLIVEFEGNSIGVIDLHANHPDEGICYMGLLLIEQGRFGKGLGRQIYFLTEDYVRRAWGCRAIRLGISNDNDVSVFWQKMGFSPNGRTYQWQGEEKVTSVREFEKVLS